MQLEWWHHPVVAGWLCSGIHPEMRLVIWSHVSGLHPPEILPGFVDIPHRFLFTSPCSLERPSLAHRFLRPDPKYDAVFSSGGFDDFPEPPRRTYAGPTRAGYVGTLNFAKLHPRFLDYIAAVNVPGFTVALVGDPTTAAALQAQAGRLGITDSLEIRGYKSDVIGELARFDIFPYLLNPLHYGTTENALLEAMAMGVVPIVLDNPAERHIVRNGETGLTHYVPSSFAEAVKHLAENPGKLQMLSENASRDIRQRFSLHHTADNLEKHYRSVLPEPKRTIDFRPLFGTEPACWFRSCMGSESWRFTDDPKSAQSPAGTTPGPHYLYEETKGSVFHYSSTFPGDVRLRRWAEHLEAHQ